MLRRSGKRGGQWLSINVLDANYALVADDDGRPSGGIGQAGQDSPYTGLVAYFPVGDVDTALVRAEHLGAECVLPPTDTPVSRIAVFTDPDGNQVGLVGR